MEKKQQLSILLYLAGIISLCACTPPYPESIQQTERIIREHPDSALVILNSIKEEMQKESQSTKMYYSLLLTEACDRCSIPLFPDSLMIVVTRYYEKERDKDKLMKSYYYMGRRQVNLNDIPTAFPFFLKALDASAKTKDDVFIGQIYSQIGHSFAHLNGTEEAIKEYQKAYSYYRQGKDSRASTHALIDLAKTQESVKRTAHYLNEILKELAKKQENTNEQEMTSPAEHTTYSGSIYEVPGAASLQRIRALYDIYHLGKKKESLLEENSKQRLWIIGIILSTAIVISLFIQYHKEKRTESQEQEKKLRMINKEQYRTSQQHIEDNKKEIRELEKQMTFVQQEKDKLKEKLLLAQKDRLVQTNHSIEASQREQALLEEALRKTDIYAFCFQAMENSSIVFTEKEWGELKYAVNETYNDFTNRLFVLYPSLTSIELHICLLLKIQIPVSTISQLICRTQSAVSMSRKQLYKKIFKKEGTSALLDEFIVAF